MDPRIAQVLINNPNVKDFLMKHNGMMSNLNAANIRYASGNLRKLKKTEKPTTVDHVIGRQVSISSLPPEALEQEVRELFEDCGLDVLKVHLPRESRRQRSCCTAFALLPSRDQAREAVAKLNGAMVRGQAVEVELLADGDSQSPLQRPSASRHALREEDGYDPFSERTGSKRKCINWQKDHELWEVALYTPNESVAEFSRRLHSPAASPPAFVVASPPKPSRFQERARSECEGEGKALARKSV